LYEAFSSSFHTLIEYTSAESATAFSAETFQLQLLYSSRFLPLESGIHDILPWQTYLTPQRQMGAHFTEVRDRTGCSSPPIDDGVVVAGCAATGSRKRVRVNSRAW
jgi:hypothetical protein